jgi:hypothetical protein
MQKNYKHMQLYSGVCIDIPLKTAVPFSTMLQSYRQHSTVSDRITPAGVALPVANTQRASLVLDIILLITSGGAG